MNRGVRICCLLGVVGLLLLVAAGCERNERDRQSQSGQSVPGNSVEAQAEQVTGTIVALGDSLTAGLGVEESESYPGQLERRLRADGHHYRVINAGVSGETTSGTLSRLEWVLTMAPDIVILEIGANDGLRGIDPAVPAKNIREIVRVLREKEVIVVFAGMKMVWNLGPAYTQSFNAIYPGIAEEFDLIFMPFFLEGVATVRELNIEDGLHPNGRGYELIVNNLYPHVLEAIEQFEKKRGN